MWKERQREREILGIGSCLCWMLATQKFAGPVGRLATPVRADVAVVCGEKSFLLGRPQSFPEAFS